MLYSCTHMATRVKFCRKLFNDDTLANVSDSFRSSDGTVYRAHDTDSRRTCRRYPVSIQQVTGIHHTCDTSSNQDRRRVCVDSRKITFFMTLHHELLDTTDPYHGPCWLTASEQNKARQLVALITQCNF